MTASIPLTEAQFDAALRTVATSARTFYAGETRRIDRGLTLALNGAVSLHDHAPASVRSDSNPEVSYNVNGECECPDFIRGNAPDGRCKHRWAVALARKARALCAASLAQTYHATYYAPSGEAIPGTATYDAASRMTVFLPGDGRESLYPAPEAIALGGLVSMDPTPDTPSAAWEVCHNRKGYDRPWTTTT